MRILVTNDDGHNSPGLWALAAALKDVGEVSVVAPDRDQSGVGTAMTLLEVVRATEIRSPVEGVQAYSVQGTPADCVILATETLFEDTFDLVASGINQGSNLGLDVLSSGTVGAALHGYLRDIPSLAVSVASLTNVQYEEASRAARALARAVLNSPMPAMLLLNVNVPNVGPDGVKGVEITRLGPRAYLESVERGYDGRRTHYWIKHNRSVTNPNPDGTDFGALQNDQISITPLHGLLSGRDHSAELQDVVGQVRSAMGVA